MNKNRNKNPWDNSTFNRNFNVMWTLSSIFIGVIFVLIGVGIVVNAVSYTNCKNRRYVHGQACRGINGFMTCRDTMVYDGCDD